LFDYLDITLLTTIEPLPGLPPTPKHIKYLLEEVVDEKLDYIVMADIYNAKEAKRIQKETGAELLILPVTLEMRTKKRGYFEFIDSLISAF
jgi:zinc/manganese transport system substrate-binding protein